MSREIFARWRHLDLGFGLTNEDFFDCLRRLEARYPETIYFNAGTLRQIPEVWGNGGPIMTIAEMTSGKDAPVIFRSWQECINAVPIVTNSEKTRRRHFFARVPWPDEITSGVPGKLTGSRTIPYQFAAGRDFAAWRAFGRLVSIDWNMDFPTLFPARQCEKRQPYNWNKHLDWSDLDHCYALQYALSSTTFDLKYCHNDMEMRTFANAIKGGPTGLLTRDYGVYECKTGRYLGDDQSRRSRISKRLMKILAINSHSYQWIWSLHSIVKDSENPNLRKLLNEPDRWIGIGPTPRMKAEAFLEAGRSIDDIDGLDQATRDAELRRHEKRQKAAAKAAGGSDKRR